MPSPFRHVDRDQTIVFGPGAVERADDLIGHGFTLLTTARASASVPALAERAAAVVEVPPGPVHELAAQLRDRVPGERLVALGGGRVIDVAKAIAAADGRLGPVAIPTSLSGAEMTGVHRHAVGVPDGTPRVRATVVVNDPALSASQPADQLAASSANALAHAITALASTRTTPIARAVADEAIDHLGCGWGEDEPDRPQIALGALLAGWAVDRSGLGPHHALSQTAVRTAGLSHAETNAALLPHTTRAFGLDGALATRLHARAGAPGLGPLVTDDELLERAVATAARRPELDRIPPALTAEQIRALYRAAA